MQDYNDNSKNRNTRRTATGRPQGQTRQGTRSQNSTGQAQRRRTTSQGQRQPIRNNQGRRPQRSRRNDAKRKRRKIILFIVEIFLLLIVLMVAAGIWLNNKANQIQYVEFTEDDIDVNDEVQEAIDNGTSALKGFRTVALFGVDSTKGELEKNTRTDTIMIASINLDTNEVRLCSIMRDTWLNMGTDTYNKANAAYAKGGPKQAISMLNMNLDLNITDFVTVGFDALIDAIDAVGGIEIDVKESEIVHLNNYQISIIGHETGTLNAAGEPNYYAEPYVEYIPVEEAGLQTLDGLQATGYCRIRYVGNDYERTSRQRTVLTKLAKKCLTLNPTVLNGIADAVFPEVYTSLTKSEIVSLIAGIASYSVGDNANFPFDGYVQNGRINGASVVVPVDLSKNVSLLHEFLFDEEDYEPTETVKKCSQKIVSDSGMSYSGD